MSLTVESIMLKYGLDRDRATTIFEKTAAFVNQVEDTPELRNRFQMVKKAAMDPVTKQVLLHIGGGLAGAAAGALVHSTLEGMSEAKNRVLRERNIKQMQSAHPELRNYASKDLHLAYNTLSRTAPSVASDPLLGGQFIKYVVARNDVPIDMLNNISKMGPGGGKGNYHANIAADVSRTLAGAPQAYAQANKASSDMWFATERNAREEEKHPLDIEGMKLRNEDSKFKNRSSAFQEDLNTRDENTLFDQSLPLTPPVVEARANYRKNEGTIDPLKTYDRELASARAKRWAEFEGHQQTLDDAQDWIDQRRNPRP